MKRTLMYVFGEPGAGKTTLVRHLTRGLFYRPDNAEPFAHRRYMCGVVELGVHRAEFGGTDGLSMSVQPKVIEWLRDDGPELVLAEGDRLANGAFFGAARDAGYALRLYFLRGEDAARLHRQIRGSGQNEKWVAGRRTKVYNLAKTWWPKELPAGEPLSELERRIARDDDNAVYAALEVGRAAWIASS